MQHTDMNDNQMLRLPSHKFYRATRFSQRPLPPGSPKQVTVFEGNGDEAIIKYGSKLER
jgi:hypothetical protein